MLSIIFYKLLRMSLVASFIGISIILIKKILYKRISPKILYVMWTIFLIALIVPPFIKSKTSVYNYIDISRIEDVAYDYQKVEYKPLQETKINTQNAENVQINWQVPSLKSMFPLFWLIGTIILISIYIISNIIFKFKIGNIKFENERIIELFENAKSNFKIKKNILLIKQEIVKTPAIIGTFKPKVLLTDDITNYNDSEIAYIFRHELAHYKRKDNIINSILILLRSLHWFNPMIWLIMKEIRKDMEFTADEIATKNLTQEEKKDYCKLLVNVSNNVAEGFMQKAIGITDDKSNLEKRINMIKISDKISKHPVFAACLVFIIIGLICLILYTNNYYEPKLDMPPVLYLENDYGKKAEMLLVKYNWLSDGDIKTFDMNFDPDKYVFEDRNTISTITTSEIPPVYGIYSKPNIKINCMNYIVYTKRVNLMEDPLDHYEGTQNFIPNINDVKYKPLYVSDGINELEIEFANGSTATYVVQINTFDLCSKEVLKNFENTDINDKSKVEELVKTMKLGSFLKDIKIENDTLYLHYAYAQEKNYAYNMSAVLFANIPSLEKIIISTEHAKAVYPIDLEYDTSIPIEVTREITNQKAKYTIDYIQKITKES